MRHPREGVHLIVCEFVVHNIVNKHGVSLYVVCIYLHAEQRSNNIPGRVYTQDVNVHNANIKPFCVCWLLFTALAA